MNEDNRLNNPENGGPGESEALEAQIDAMMKNLSIEKAPASLSRKLKRIPREQRRNQRRSGWQFSIFQFPRWAMAPALAMASLLAVGIVLMQPKQPSEAEVEQARQELALAFAYLDKAGYRTGSEIQSVLGGGLRDSVKDNLSKHIPFTKQSLKEKAI